MTRHDETPVQRNAAGLLVDELESSHDSEDHEHLNDEEILIEVKNGLEAHSNYGEKVNIM